MYDYGCKHRTKYRLYQLIIHYIKDSGGGRFNNGGPVKIKTPHEEEEDGNYNFP